MPKPVATEPLPRGLYRHAKSSGLYQLLGESFHSETLEEMVIYQALYGDYQFWVRPKKMWLEEVEIKGKSMPRFIKINGQIV